MTQDQARKYTFMAYTLMENTKLMELPLYGVYMESLLNDVGQFNGVIQFGGDKNTNRDLKEATTPGKTVVYAYEDGYPIEAYIVWTRTYQGTSRTLQITGQTLESYAYHNILQTAIERYDKAQSDQLANIWTLLQGTTHGNILVDANDLFLTTFGALVDVEVYPKQFRTYGEVMEEIMNQGSGIDIKILPYPQFDIVANPDQPLLRKVRAGLTLGRLAAQSNLVFEFPGNLSNYWYTENAAEAANRVFATSTDAGWETVVASAQDDVALGNGYPALEQRFIYEGIRGSTKLANKASTKLNKLKLPSPSLTMEIEPAKMPLLKDIILGDEVTFTALDEWFPDSFTMTSRMLGWNISLGDDETPDSFKFIIQGSDDA